MESFLLPLPGIKLKDREINTQKNQTNQPNKNSTYCGVVCAHKRLLFQFLCFSVFEAWFPLTLGLAGSVPYYSKCKLKTQVRYHLRKQLNFFLHQKRLEGELQLSSDFAFCSPCFISTCSSPAFQEAKGCTEKILLIFSMRREKRGKREFHLPPHLLCWAHISSRGAGLVQKCPSMASSIHPLHEGPCFPVQPSCGVCSTGYLLVHCRGFESVLFLPLFFTHLHSEYCQALLPISFPLMLFASGGNINHRTGTFHNDDIARSQLSCFLLL